MTSRRRRPRRRPPRPTGAAEPRPRRRRSDDSPRRPRRRLRGEYSTPIRRRGRRGRIERCEARKGSTVSRFPKSRSRHRRRRLACRDPCVPRRRAPRRNRSTAARERDRRLLARHSTASARRSPSRKRARRAVERSERSSRRLVSRRRVPRDAPPKEDASEEDGPPTRRLRRRNRRGWNVSTRSRAARARDSTRSPAAETYRRQIPSRYSFTHRNGPRRRCARSFADTSAARVSSTTFRARTTATTATKTRFSRRRPRTPSRRKSPRSCTRPRTRTGARAPKWLRTRTPEHPSARIRVRRGTHPPADSSVRSRRGAGRPEADPEAQRRVSISARCLTRGRFPRGTGCTRVSRPPRNPPEGSIDGSIIRRRTNSSRRSRSERRRERQRHRPSPPPPRRRPSPGFERSDRSPRNTERVETSRRSRPPPPPRRRRRGGRGRRGDGRHAAAPPRERFPPPDFAPRKFETARESPGMDDADENAKEKVRAATVRASPPRVSTVVGFWGSTVATRTTRTTTIRKTQNRRRG